ncbi:sensor histidine kinase [Actinomadura sp. HBU206391]|uniref:sensor histidine kinase n=1 Tax=Actinomadura sp. HBU206391 TaxID=2731692 RepID=UPI0016507FCD|nr:histidine kinase [Actinomadura sp. HBU206391]MBC6460455.1 sensor histidine kinase [Actinomadura sp. HBU206391]
MALTPGAPPWPLRGRAADAVVAGGVAVVVVAGALFALRDQRPFASADLLSWALIVVALVAVYFRRRWPVAMAALTLLACGLYYPLGEPDGTLLVTFIVGLYTAAAEGHLKAAVTLSVLALLATGFGETAGDTRHVDNAALSLVTGWIIAAVALGAVARNRQAYLREVEQRALDAERGREEEARRRATEERLRIARELHDVIGHNISLINVQAGAALHRIERDPEQAERALAAIKETSREALRELRATLGVLRQVDEAAPTEPVPGLAGMADLVAGAETTGLDVRTEIEGERRPVPPEVDLAAYRIVQEALTNVTRHARATMAVVRVRYGRDDVRLEIDDDGRGGDPGAGNGILGMGERARALGGELTAEGGGSAGGFRVRARLPLGSRGLGGVR